MNQISLVLLLAVSLIGCGPNSEKVAEFKATETAMQQKATSGEMTWAAYARESNRLAVEADPNTFKSPDSQAALAYRIMIAAEVDAKRLSPEQYEFLWRKQIATMAGKEEAQRKAAASALIQAGAALTAASRPQVVNCSTTRSLSSLETTCY